MKSNQLRSPLISSAILLAVFSLIVYFTLTSPEGSVFNSFGSIVVLILRTIQLAIGLALALIVSLSVLIGIFLGAVALVNPSASSRMYEGLRQTIRSWLTPLAVLLKSDKGENLKEEMGAFGATLKTDFSRMVAPVKKELAEVQGNLDTKVSTLRGKLSEVEKSVAGKASVEQVETVTAEVAAVSETLTGTEASVKTLAAKVEQAGAPDPGQILGDLPSRLEALEQKEDPEAVDLQPIEDKISALQAEINKVTQPLEEKIAALTSEITELKAALADQKTDPRPVAGEKKAGKVEKKSAPAKVAAPGKDVEEHRLLSYFSNPADKEKLADLVGQTLKKDMTYAQVTKFLVKKMGKDGGKIISEHPSLAKDYIRQCRRKG
ncbi:MAG TPA: hypothetical protein ENK84_11115 [Desulfobulbus sp.]|nr:hypothetical protein [Desulfobulbus sp.]